MNRYVVLALMLVGTAACTSSSMSEMGDNPFDDSPRPLPGEPSPIPGVDCVAWAGTRCIREGVPDDMDGDFFTSDVDCDDRNFYIFPGAPAQTDCGGPDWDCDGEAQPACPVDGDGDGWTADVDCDDADAAIHPGVEDIPCNGVDEDCTGGLDADFCDRDGDGSSAAYDCDDDDPTRIATGPRPADAVCDGIDNDCDGTDCCDNDEDGDGFSCREDCNDWDQLTYPGAPIGPGCEWEADRNCDGLPDNPCL